MGVRCVAALGLLLAIVAMAQSAALPDATDQAMIIVNKDQLTTSVPVTEATSQPTTGLTKEQTTVVAKEQTTEVRKESTTDEPMPPLKMTEMDVRSEISLRYARTAVVTRVKNPAKRAQEATFRVLLPETAFISGFTMILDGKPYKAYVKEKAEAKQIYTDAVAHGQGAAHIAAKARDSNHFTVSVNVEPSTVAVFNLTYEELLVRRNNVYNHAINLHPGTVVPKLTVTVHIKESDKLVNLRVPEVRTGNEVDATADDAQNSEAKIERGHDDREATITFKPDVQEQQRLMDVYAAKTLESQKEARSARTWGYDGGEEKAPEGVLGQFVVQYDVDRPKDGQILVSDGYFVHFFAPKSLPPLNKHVVFVLDTSGSMMDRKIVQLRQAMQTILGELNQGDYFNIVQFDSDVKVFDLKEADEPQKPTYNYNYFEPSRPVTLVPPSQATKDNVAKAKIIVSRFEASGGTNIYSALNVAIDLIQKGIGWTPEVAPASNATTITEGPKPLPLALPLAIEGKSNDTPKEKEVAKTDEKTEEGAKKLEPIIIFLTDGDPTVGETSTTKIINHLTEKNSGQNKASIFSLAFGEDADRGFLRKLSLRSDGFMRHIYEASDAALQLHDFYLQVSSPLLAHVKFTYPPEQVKKDSLTKNKFRTFYAGSETVVAGRLEDSVTELSPTIEAFCGVDDGFTRKKYEIFPKVPVAAPRGDYLPLERLWAYLTVKQLLDEKETQDEPVKSVTDEEKKDKDEENTPEKKALAIALKYEFVTPLTSLVVVKPNATKAVDAESVDKDNNNNHMYSAGLPLAAHSFGAAVGGYAGPPGAPSPQFAYSMQPRPGYISRGPNRGYISRKGVASRPLVGSGSRYTSSHASYPTVGGDRSATGWRHPTGHTATPPYPIHHYPSHLYTTQRSKAQENAQSTTPPSPPSTTLQSRLVALRLTEYPWVEQALDQDEDKITLQVNGTQVSLELTKGDAPKSDADTECSRATDGSPGVCVYLTRCDAAKNITMQLYADTHCAVAKYAGVCCPRDKVHLNTTTEIKAAA